MWVYKVLSLLLLLAPSMFAAPVAEHSTGAGSEHGTKSDLPVEQLEKLKLNESIQLGHLAGSTGAREQIDYHSLDTVKSNGDLISRLEQHATAEAASGEKPKVHSHVQLDLPSEGIHKEIVQDGNKVVETDGTTTSSNDEQTTKVFHGAARLIQAGSGTNVPQNTHTAVRRAFNADLTKEIKNNMDHYSSYTGVQYSPLDMAEYVFWTGDERSVTNAIENFLQEGLMTKEEAITFLQEIKFNIDSLRAHYAQNQKSAEEQAQQEKLRNMLLEQAKVRQQEGYSYHPANLHGYQSFPFGNSPDIIRTIASKNWDMSNSLTPALPLPVLGDFRSDPAKKSYSDLMLQSNLVGPSDYDREGAMMTDEEYEEIMDKLKVADPILTEYTLDEAIRQITKVMFAQTLSRDPREARAAMQKFMEFLEVEAETGQLSKGIGKKVLDAMIAGLTDSVGEHPELLQSQPRDRSLRHFLEQSTEPSMTRALLSAYKDDLLKGPLMRKLPYQNK